MVYLDLGSAVPGLLAGLQDEFLVYHAVFPVGVGLRDGFLVGQAVRKVGLRVIGLAKLELGPEVHSSWSGRTWLAEVRCTVVRIALGLDNGVLV